MCPHNNWKTTDQKSISLNVTSIYWLYFDEVDFDLWCWELFSYFFQIKTAYNFKTTGSAFDAVLHDDNILVGAMIWFVMRTSARLSDRGWQRSDLLRCRHSLIYSVPRRRCGTWDVNIDASGTLMLRFWRYEISRLIDYRISIISFSMLNVDCTLRVNGL